MFFRNRRAAANTVQIIIAILLTVLILIYPVYELSKGLMSRFQMLGREM